MQNAESLGLDIFQPKVPLDQHTKRSVYRFYFFPLVPDASVAVRDGRLGLRFDDQYFGYTYNLYTSTYYNIQGLIAYNYASLKHQFQSREIDPNKNIVVVDIDKSYFDQNINVQQKTYEIAPLVGLPKPFFNIQESWGSLQYQFNNNQLPFPFYAQNNVMVVAVDGHCQIRQVFNKSVEQRGPESQIKIYDYSTQNAALGQDMLISNLAPIRTAAHLREDNQRFDWVSNTNKNINKRSYLDLTQGCYEFGGNAMKIAALYEDYYTKGEGFSAFIHFHWFRHTANLLKAKVIAKALREQFKDADNSTIADYLVAQFNDLKDKHPINEIGSFARRTNYAILQLTNGLCENVAEYEQYQQQQTKQVAFVSNNSR